MDTLTITVPADQACLWLAAVSDRLDRMYTDASHVTPGSRYARRLAAKIEETEAARQTLRDQVHGRRRTPAFTPATVAGKAAA